MKTLHILCLWIVKVTCEVTIQAIDTVLLPQNINLFSTFQINAQTRSDARVNLTVSCSKDILQAGLKFQQTNICEYKFKGEKVNDINDLLNGLSVDLGSVMLSENPFVEYVFTIELGKNANQMNGKVVQHFKLMSQIPVVQLTDEVLLNEGSATKLKVLDIDPLYLKISNLENLSFELTNKELINFVRPEFKGGALYLLIDFDDQVSRYLSFDFVVRDSLTHLTSQPLHFRVRPIVASFLLDRKTVAIVLGVHILILVSLIIYLLTRVNNEKTTIDKSVNKPAKSEKPNATEVLTRSILEWQKDSKHDIMWNRSTQDISSMYDTVQSSIDLSDKTNFLSIQGCKLDESIMNEIDEFSAIIRKEKTGSESNADSIVIDDINK